MMSPLKGAQTDFPCSFQGEFQGRAIGPAAFGWQLVEVLSRVILRWVGVGRSSLSLLEIVPLYQFPLVPSSLSFCLRSFISFFHFLPCETVYSELLPNKISAPMQEDAYHFHTHSPKTIFTDHGLRKYCLSLVLLFFPTLYITLPLEIPVFCTENQTDVSVGEKGRKGSPKRQKDVGCGQRSENLPVFKATHNKIFSIHYMKKERKETKIT